MSHPEQPHQDPRSGAAPEERAGDGTNSAGQPRPAWAEPEQTAKAGQPAEQVVAAVPQVTEVTEVSEVDAAPMTEPAGRPLGREADEVVAAPVEPRRTGPQLSPQERLRRQNWLGLGGRVIGGLVTLAALLAVLSSGWEWSNVLFLWVLLAILADEFGGWFGYIAAFMGLLTLLMGNQPDDTWKVLLPLVGGALLALLVVKHSGGWIVLPFAAAVFALPIIAAAQFGHLLDENLLLVADPNLQRSALLAMLMGLGVSLVRQVILWIVDLTGRRAERRLLHADQAPVR
ncbi:hypothetical protein [Deinococcus sp. Marseille-Q6407]|uniref:hypothetical protein n=1 Tax=Deinococcus sp. Marseille-Q6407 TaxID=2969223 RepID=UPI0021BE6CA8|nr:hypothetical protein [Deinococcus sp. Marseille-Q6407]